MCLQVQYLKITKLGFQKVRNRPSFDQPLIQTIMSQITTFQFWKNMKVLMDQLKP